MLRTIASLTFCPLICAALLYLGLHLEELNQDFDGDEIFLVRALVGLFFFIFAWVSYRRWIFHWQKEAALATEPVSAQINITATSQSRGPDSLVAEIDVEDVRWRAVLICFAHDKAMSGKPGEGLAWLHPKTNAPLAVEFGGKRLSIVPEVVKVVPGSLMEKIVQKARG